jgi:hypothetical protein
VDAAVTEFRIRRLDTVGNVAEQHVRVGKTYHLILGSSGIDDLPERRPVFRGFRSQVDTIARVTPGEQRAEVFVRDRSGVGEVAFQDGTSGCQTLE